MYPTRAAVVPVALAIGVTATLGAIGISLTFVIKPCLFTVIYGTEKVVSVVDTSPPYSPAAIESISHNCKFAFNKPLSKLPPLVSIVPYTLPAFLSLSVLFILISKDN
jgi:hypothetical protein